MKKTYIKPDTKHIIFHTNTLMAESMISSGVGEGTHDANSKESLFEYDDTEDTNAF